MRTDDDTPRNAPHATHPPQKPEVHLRLLNLTDLHMEIRGYDYFNDAPTRQGGLIHAATLIETRRAEVPNTLLFDNGDILQGNPMGDYAAQQLRLDTGFAHPMIAALNTLNLDAATLGNHEFNYGLPVLQAALDQATFPIVSANITISQGVTPDLDTTLVPPFVLLPKTVTDTTGRAHDLTIGVLGLAPPQIVYWDRAHLDGQVQTRDIVATAEDHLPKLRATGADLIVVLCHSGLEDADDPTGLENAAAQVAGVPGVDAVIAGHSHLVFPSADFTCLSHTDLERGLIQNTPVTMAGFGGSHLGRIDLVLTLDDAGWTVRQARAVSEPVKRLDSATGKSSAAILQATEAAHEATLAYVRQPVGQTDRALNSYFAMVEPAPSVLLVATAQAWYMTEALRGTPFEHLPLLSAAAPFKMGGRSGPGHFTDVPAGEIAMRNVADLYGYPNQLRAVEVSGAALRDWLEFNAGLYAQITPNSADQPLLDPAFPSYNFDTITGVTYAFDLSQPARFTRDGVRKPGAAQRVRDLCWNGQAVTDEMRFVVATNDYRTSQSGAYPGADDGAVVLGAHDTHRDVLVRYIRDTPPGRTLLSPPWRLMPVTGASVIFDTSPKALQDQARLKTLSVQPLGPTEAGFLSCRKRLT